MMATRRCTPRHGRQILGSGLRHKESVERIAMFGAKRGELLRVWKRRGQLEESALGSRLRDLAAADNLAERCLDRDFLG